MPVTNQNRTKVETFGAFFGRPHDASKGENASPLDSADPCLNKCSEFVIWMLSSGGQDQTPISTTGHVSWLIYAQIVHV